MAVVKHNKAMVPEALYCKSASIIPTRMADAANGKVRNLIALIHDVIELILIG